MLPNLVMIVLGVVLAGLVVFVAFLAVTSGLNGGVDGEE